MRRIKSMTVFLAAATLFVAVAAQAESDTEIQPVKIKTKAAPGIKPAPSSMPQAPALTGPKQAYQLVTDVFDGFGGESESEHYRVKVLSGGQPSAIGISEEGSYLAEAGYVHASFVMRGDANFDRTIDVGDIVFLVNFLFYGAYGPDPLEAGDADCNGEVDVGDIVYLVNYVLLGGMPPPC